MRPTLPSATPSEAEPDEPPTGKMSVLSEAKVACPACGGRVVLAFEPVLQDGQPDMHRYGEFRVSWCGMCAESNGIVTAAEAETIRAAIKGNAPKL